MTASITESYEQVPYESAPIQKTYPDNLAAIATLFGMRPAPPDRCRVLELGCATGGNLIAMAEALPHSCFVGLDLSPGHIATAQALADRLGLTNLDLRAASILDVGPELGEFDYIICHGVYSWVPPEVQAHILTICQGNLAPQGVAYVSYNVYPGWHVGAMIRDMLNFHGRRFPEPLERVRQARQFLEFLAGMVSRDPGSGVYGRLLAEQAAGLREETESYLFHEYLEKFNQPVYFYQFAQRAAAKGLQFLSEAYLSAMVGTLSAEVKNTLHGWSEGLVEYEQYLDFLRDRKFRMSLLCHDDVELKRMPEPEVMEQFRFSAAARPLTEGKEIAADAVEQFRTPSGVTFSTNNPLIKAVLHSLFAVHPRALSFHDLANAVQARLSSGGPFREALLQCAISSLVELHLATPPFLAKVSERPVASPLARWQALTDNRVTNRRHRLVELNGFDRLLLPALDGSRDRGALLDYLVRQVGNGVPLEDEKGQPIDDPVRVRELLDQGLTVGLRRLRDSALLVG